MKEYFSMNKIKNAPFRLLERDCTLMILEKHKEKELVDAVSGIGVNYYISSEELEEAIVNKKLTREVIIKRCIPDKGNVMAGEFGEILSTELIQEEILSDSDAELYNPFKLRWKEDRNKAALKTDVVLITSSNNCYKIYSGEIKCKCNGKIEDTIHEMFDGIRNDRASRLAETLYWMQEKETRSKYSPISNLLLLDGLIEKIRNFKPIKKEFIGVLVTDKKLYTENAMQSVKAICIAHKSSVKKHLEVLKELGINIHNDGKTLDFTGVEIDAIMKLPERNHKEIEVKNKILNWFNCSNIVLNQQEVMKIKVITIDNLKDNYEKTFDMIK